MIVSRSLVLAVSSITAACVRDVPPFKGNDNILPRAPEEHYCIGSQYHYDMSYFKTACINRSPSELIMHPLPITNGTTKRQVPQTMIDRY